MEQKQQTYQSRSVNVDDLLNLIKPCGRYQYFMIFVYTYAAFAHLCNMQFMGLSGLKPTWTCNDANLTHTTPVNDCIIYRECSSDNLSFTFQFSSVVHEWGLFCDRSYYSSLMTTLQMIGVLCGSLAIGPITDTCGRKWTFIITLSFELCLGIFSAISTTWQIFAVFRFFIGFALGGALVCGWVLAAEFTTNRYRFIIRAVAGAFLVQFDLTVIGYLTRDWRLYSIIGNAQVLPLLPLLYFCTYESPRWLLQKGKVEEAENVLKKIGKFNKTSHLLPVNIFKSQSNLPNSTKNSIKFSQYFALDLFRSKKLTLYTFVLIITYFSLSTINYGMFFGLNDLGFNIYITMLLLSIVSIFELPVAIYDAYNINVNRKYLLLIFSCMAVASNLTVTILLSLGGGTLSKHAYTGIVATISVIGQLTSNVALDIANMYSVELFPTLLRSSAGATSSIGARLGSILAPQLIFFESVWTPLPYCCFTAIGAIGLVFVALFLPNTKNAKLPESFHSASSLADQA